MIYSVWNHASRVYDYYQSPESSAATSAPKPAHLRSTSPLGLSPEQAGWPLPANAKLVGHGKYPRGHIASKSSGALGLGILPVDLTPTNMLLLGVLGYVGYRYLKRRRVL